MNRTSMGITLGASLALAVAVAPAITSVAHDGTGGADTMHVCVVKSTSDMRLVGQNPAIDCPDGQVARHFDLQGPKGDTGATGPKGDAGDPGGPQGDTGSAGPQGDTGSQGPAGATGPQGTQGATGSAGPQGATGSQGPAGATGAAGATGPAGPQGATGSQGPKGDKGDAGGVTLLSASGQDTNNRTYRMIAAVGFSATAVACGTSNTQAGSGIDFDVSLNGSAIGTCTVTSGNTTGSLAISETVTAGDIFTVVVSENAGGTRSQSFVGIGG